MTSHSINGHEKLSNAISFWVKYEGTDALFKGEGVCYNSDYGTPGDADARRANRVERPTVDNSYDFAGVAARNYSAQSLGQMIEIYGPGSKSVPVALAVDTTLGSGLLTFVVAGKYNKGASTGLKTDAGRFYSGKFAGRGSAIPRQTVTAVLEASMSGGWSIAADGVTLTVTSTTGLAAGDTVVLLGGEDDNTGTVIPGKYTISSVTDSTTLVLTSSCVDVTTTALTCTGYAYTGNPTALCDLLDGDESRGIEFLSCPADGGDTQPYMVGGVTYLCGGVTISADAEIELAQGVYPGEVKAFVCLGTMTTKDWVVDLATNGIRIDGSSALAEINAINAAADACYLEFHGARWFTQDVVGGATEA